MSLVSIFAGTVNSYVPPAPIIGSASLYVGSGANGTLAQITYTAPTYNSSLVPTITSFTVYAVEDPTKNTTVSTSSSGTINVASLSLGSTYTFKAYATNAFGRGPDSSPSNSITATPIGQNVFTTPGAATFTVPTNVTSISILLIGGGGCGGIYYGSGGGGGSLTYLNNYAVTPGQTFNIFVGDGGNNSTFSGQTSWFGNSSLLFAGGGGAGGDGLSGYINSGGGGGGAAGYSGQGGDGGMSNNDGSFPGSLAAWYGYRGVGGGTLPGLVTYSGGRGGQGYLATQCSFSAATLGGGGGAAGGGSGQYQGGAGGGGVGIYGQSSVDSAGNPTTAGPATTKGGGGGTGYNNGGSGGVSYSSARNSTQPPTVLYGAGSGGGNGRLWGSRGAVRIVYPGDRRQFPSTNVGNF